MRGFFSKFVTLILILLLFAGFGYFYANSIETNLLTTEDVKIDSDISYKVVFFSDTHFGKLYSQKNIERIVDTINSNSPDLVVFGGDFFDNYSRDKSILELDYIQNELSRIKSKYGKYGVMGNHDYGGGASRIYKKTMENGGFTLLKNSEKLIPQLNVRLIGLDDMLMGRPKYGIKGGAYPIIISHEPDMALSQDSPTDGLMLSGHSHGGQVSIPVLTKKFLPEGANVYVRGRYDNVGINNNLTLFVSNGIGTTIIPLRFLSPPQIVCVYSNS